MDASNQSTPVIGRERRRGSIVGPSILILLGVLFLGQNLGWVSPSIWSTLLNFWPVLLILIGAELMLGRGRWVGALVTAIVVISIISVLSIVGTFAYNSNVRSIGTFTPVQTINVSEEMGQTKRASYNLEFGAGSLNVSALPSGSAKLIDGTLEREDGATIDHNVNRQGDLTTVTIRGRTTGAFLRLGSVGRTQMTVKLSPQTPGELTVSGGAGQLDLDLASVPLTYFELNAGVGGSNITLPQSGGRLSAKVNAGVGGVDVTIPEGVAAQIKYDKGLGGFSVDSGRFPSVGDNTYRSANFDSAANRVDLYVSGGVGGTTIH